MVVFTTNLSMIMAMQSLSLKRMGCAVACVALATVVVRANVDTNPYAPIADRNVFALKPPPPPPPPPEATAPPVPMAQVTLTGLLSTFGEPRVLLEIIEEPGKGAATAKRPPPMREGERLGPVEVLAIDVVKNMVRIRNSGVETNVTFPVVKTTPTPGGPGVPPPINVPQPLHPQASAPTVISPNNANPGGGVTLVGGGANTAATPTALGANDGGMRSIPSRPLRTENAGAPMTKEQADLLMEVNRLRGGPPLPPTPYTPTFQGAQQETGNPAQANPNPRLRGSPPPLPGQR